MLLFPQGLGILEDPPHHRCCTTRGSSPFLPSAAPPAPAKLPCSYTGQPWVVLPPCSSFAQQCFCLSPSDTLPALLPWGRRSEKDMVRGRWGSGRSNELGGIQTAPVKGAGTWTTSGPLDSCVLPFHSTGQLGPAAKRNTPCVGKTALTKTPHSTVAQNWSWLQEA